MFASYTDALAMAGQLFRTQVPGQQPFILDAKGFWQAPDLPVGEDGKQLVTSIAAFRPALSGWLMQAEVGASTLFQSGRERLLAIATEVEGKGGIFAVGILLPPAGLESPDLPASILLKQLDGLAFVTDGTEARSWGKLGLNQSASNQKEGLYELWSRLLILSQDVDGFLALAFNRELNQEVYSLATCSFLTLEANAESGIISGLIKGQPVSSNEIFRFFTYTANPAPVFAQHENRPIAAAFQAYLAHTGRRTWAHFLAKAGQHGYESSLAVEVPVGAELHSLEIKSELVFGPRGAVLGHHHSVRQLEDPVLAARPYVAPKADVVPTSPTPYPTPTQVSSQEQSFDSSLLIAEANHRIKNSISVAASLMQLQSYSVEDEHARQILMDSVQRLYTVADLHEALYKFAQPGSERVKMQPFLQQMSGRLQKLLGEKGIEIRTEIEDIELSGKTANRVALLINELVLNAAKYAFPDGRQGFVAIYFTKTDTTLYLSVQDNGQGIDARDRNDASSLGSTLIQEFAKELQATTRLETAAGTRYVFTFPA